MNGMDSYLNKKILRQDLQDYFFAEGDLFFQAFPRKARDKYPEDHVNPV